MGAPRARKILKKNTREVERSEKSWRARPPPSMASGAPTADANSAGSEVRRGRKEGAISFFSHPTDPDHRERSSYYSISLFARRPVVSLSVTQHRGGSWWLGPMYVSPVSVRVAARHTGLPPSISLSLKTAAEERGIDWLIAPPVSPVFYHFVGTTDYCVVFEGERERALVCICTRAETLDDVVHSHYRYQILQEENVRRRGELMNLPLPPFLSSLAWHVV